MTLQPEHFIQIIQYLGLKSKRSQSGARRFYYCPFHSEKTPSFSVDLEKGLYRCFACNDGGNFYQLVRRLTGRTVEDVLGLDDPFLAQSLGVQIAQPKIEKEPEEDDSSVLLRGSLTPVATNAAAVRYLESRGIPLVIAESVHMTYAEEVYMNGTKIVDRICVPILSGSGKLINMDCRDITRQPGVPKVLYPRGCLKTVFEHWKLDKTQPLFILEGMVKLLVARTDAYFANSTTLFGASPSPLQLKILNTFSEIIHIPDNDHAGDLSVKFMQEHLDTKYSVLRLGDETLKDVDEIPTKKHMSVQDFRLSGGFFAQSIPSIVF